MIEIYMTNEECVVMRNGQYVLKGKLTGTMTQVLENGIIAHTILVTGHPPGDRYTNGSATKLAKRVK